MTDRRNPEFLHYNQKHPNVQALRLKLVLLWGLVYLAMVVLGFNVRADELPTSETGAQTNANPFPLMQPEFTPLHEDEYATTKFGDLDGFFSIVSNQPLKIPAFDQLLKKDISFDSIYKSITYISKSNPGGSIERPANKEPFCLIFTKGQTKAKTLDGFFFVARFKKLDIGLKISYFDDYSNDVFNISCDTNLSLAEIREMFSPGAPDKFGFMRLTGLRLSSVCEYTTGQMKPGESVSSASSSVISDECKKLQPVWVEKNKPVKSEAVLPSESSPE